MKKLYSYIKSHILSDFAADIGEHHLTNYTESADGTVCDFEPCGNITKLKISAKLGEDAVVLYLDAGCIGGFAPAAAVSFTLGDMKPDALLGSFHSSEAWMYPSFGSDFADLKPKTQSLFIKSGALNYHLLPLCGDNFRCEFEAGKMIISSNMSGLTHLSGAFLSVSVSTDPYAAVDNNYRYAREVGAIRVPLIDERPYPELFEGFGWCTWDAFYNKVTSEGIFRKLDEFREKGIDVKWVIIDDGWLSLRDGRLDAFAANDQFPEGLKAAVAKMKKNYGIRYVGVWHAFHGYWEGVCHDSKLAAEYAECLESMKVPKSKPPYLVPSLDTDKGERFWEAWYSFLEDCGVDFVKVDDQSASPRFYAETMPTAEACRCAHEAIERAVNRHFNGVILNCMGMDMENVLARPHSALSRNSDDFYPNRERSFIRHLIQNAYNAVWHSKLYHCDFDMWWSGLPESAVQSGVLRAVSGSPVYVSDKVGESIAENIAPLMEDGLILRCDCAARPTYDCFYTDCSTSGKHLKIWNRSGDCFTLAAFNVSEGELTDSVDFGMIPELSHECDYVAYEYFSKKFARVNFAQDTELTLLRDGCAVWSLYPIKNDGDGEYIMLGDVSKYTAIASKHKVRTSIGELIK